MSTQPSPTPFREPAQPQPSPVPVPTPPQPGRPRRRWMLLAALVAVGLGGLLWMALRTEPARQTGSGNVVQPAPTPGQIVPTRLRISGETQARNFVTITVPTFRGPDSGRNLTLLKAAPPGSFVKEGDLVAELDAQSLKDHIDDVQDQVDNAVNAVEKKKAQLEVDWVNLQQNLKVAKANWDKAVLDQKAAEVNTDIEKEIARLNVEEAEASYKQLQKELADEKASQAADLKYLEIEVQRQKIHLNNHLRDLKDFTVRAPMSGLIVMVQTFRHGETQVVSQGDEVRPGMPIMKIVDLSSMELEAKVSQADSNRFRVGQKAEIGLDAFPGLNFEGEIYSIGALANKGSFDQYYVATVPVNIAIHGSDPRLIPDLSAWAFVDTRGRREVQQASAGPLPASK